MITFPTPGSDVELATIIGIEPGQVSRCGSTLTGPFLEVCVPSNQTQLVANIPDTYNGTTVLIRIVASL